ncbi:GNAT family N-acetyltransferase [Neptunomonas phycophila]|uniref:GNAT family N-acetyltransferase n=1 Tax=Neptunomonas phycophila TaxID=1572645 RepID=UPI001BECA119|nr:N-acetyltransferase [Neptunomonas phycophila]MBT3145438.1 N-acetyltransferase [Neptunomonas phycophila]
MKYSLFTELKSREVIDLFRSVFSESEGEAEGQVISDFVSSLLATTKPQDLIGCIAEENERVVGCVFFSRFTVPSGQAAFILSPVAVSTEVQGSGIGKELIGYGLDHLRSQDVNLAFTYGDPTYYSKMGFKQISENIVNAPFPLSQPIGWLAQSLDGQEIQAMAGPTQCVDALNDPGLW